MSGAEIRDQLRTWIRKRAKLAADKPLNDDSPILEANLLTSLDVAELFVYIESLRGEEVDLATVEPTVLKDINTLYAAFFTAAAAN
ncbi:hypothetical protein L6R52_36600 [Myxococcota bacterium]|nr:hypothetical protein [Myxococcota bacterium]